MNAELFRGDADGTPLPNCRGLVCDSCGTLYTVRGEAEACGVEPNAVVDGTN